MRHLAISLVVWLGVVVCGRAYADAPNKAVIIDTLTKLATAADGLAKEAANSDDRGARKKFAPRAREIADDLNDLATTARKEGTTLARLGGGIAPIDKDAAGLPDLADEIEDKTERKAMRQKANLLQQAVSATRKLIDSEAAKGDAKPAPTKPTPISDASFQKLVAAIEAASFDKDKVQVVQSAAKVSWFTTAQVGAMMELVSFEDGKVDIAAACWARIVDVENRVGLYSKLTFSSSKDKLRGRVGG